MNPLLEIKDLTVRYASRRRRGPVPPAVDGVSLSIRQGETLGLVGESGSGKSTIGNAVLGLVPVTSGSIRFEGEEIAQLDPRSRRRLAGKVQAVFQDPYSSFNPNIPIGVTMAETLSQERVDKATSQGRVADMLERVGLERSAADRFPAEFSGGQRQRIAIARALLPRPRLVVCDESVSALDLSVQAQVLNLLADLQRELGVAYLFITHDMSVVRHVSSRLLVLRAGTMVEDGPTEQVLESPQHIYTERLVAASPVPDPDEQAIRRDARRAIRTLEDTESVEGTWQELRDLRRAIERKIVFDLASAASGDVLARIRSLAIVEDHSTRSSETSGEREIEFHGLLFELSGYAKLPSLGERYEELLRRCLGIPDGTSSPSVHMKICDAIENHDGLSAARLVEECC